MIQAPLTSLAGARTGDSLLIHRILFDGLRTLCAELDLHEGDTVRCQAEGPGQLLLLTPHGRVIELERGWARFVEVSREPGATDRTPPGTRPLD